MYWWTDWNRQSGKKVFWIYLETRDFTKVQLQELFKSVGWLSANYPERLFKAMNNCETVFTAWDNDKLVGLINAIDDGELT